MATSLVEVAFFLLLYLPYFGCRELFRKKNYKNSCITKIVVVDLCWIMRTKYNKLS